MSGLAMGHENICHHFFISGCDAFELLERNKRGNLVLRVNRQLKVFAGLVEKSEKALAAIPDDKIHLILGNQHAAKPDQVFLQLILVLPLGVLNHQLKQTEHTLGNLARFCDSAVDY